MDKLKSFEPQIKKEIPEKDAKLPENSFEKEKNPEVKFGVNLEKNIATSYYFIQSIIEGRKPSGGVFDIHPELEKQIMAVYDTTKEFDAQEEQMMKVIRTYFTEFYKEHEKELQEIAQKYEEDWKKIESEFFIRARKVFNNHPFPEGRYIADLSIIRRCPRFLKDMTYQIYHNFSPPNVRRVSMHELFHFILFDYAKKKIPQFKDINPRECEMDSTLWRVSEVHDPIILADPEFAELTGIDGVICSYPHLQKYLEPLGNYWRETRDIDKWIEYAYKFIEEDRKSEQNK